MPLDFNVKPYFDDYDQAGTDGLSPMEKYYRILFQPGVAVQARELTQIQSMLQNQVTQFGNYAFKEGSMVIPGNVYHENQVDYIRLDTADQITDEELILLNTLAGYGFGMGTISNAANSLSAKILEFVPASGADPQTLYVQYENSGTDGASAFSAGQSLNIAPEGGGTITVRVDSGSDAIGQGSIAYINRGIYFTRGHFIIVQEQHVLLDKYGNPDPTDTAYRGPSYDIGLLLTEKIQTPSNDSTLNDNAQGSPNLAAPGAHRYMITSELVKRTVNTPADENFILLQRLNNGAAERTVRESDSAKYSVLEQTFARRTFDESGNYTVSRFDIFVDSHATDSTKLTISLEPGKGYVQGYEVETLASTNVDIDRARDDKLLTRQSVTPAIGNYIRIKRSPSGATSMPNIGILQKINLLDSADAVIGTCRVKTVEFDQVIDGENHYNLYIFDIRMTGSNSFKDSAGISAAAISGSNPHPAITGIDIVQTNSNAQLIDATRDTLVFPLPFSRVRTLSHDGSGYNFIYHVNKYYSPQTITNGIVTFNTSGAGELFEPFDSENWFLVITGGADAGKIYHPASTEVVVSNNKQSVTITSTAGLPASSTAAALIAGVTKTLIHKNKHLTTGNNNNIHSMAISTQSVIESGDIQLGKADGYRLHHVYMSDDFSTPATDTDDDFAHHYDFDNGQRDNFYDLCRLRIKPFSNFVPTGRLLVEYEYFTHTGSGDFFTIDSYRNITDSDGNTIDHSNIPDYLTGSTGELIELSGAIDFRSRINDAGTDFDNASGTINDVPEPRTSITTDIRQYLDRIDKIYIDKYSRFGVVKGVSDSNPMAPPDPDNAMVLYHLHVPAYTVTPQEVDVRAIDNKRYTMRDIGRLEKRIDNIEYYTALSLLEKEAANAQVLDAETGVNRVKNGILVDSFTSHNVGDVLAPDYRAAIDRETHSLRPQFSEDNVRLMYNDALSAGTRKTGVLVTLPYTDAVLYNQRQASAWINVNPFNVFKWNGDLTLSPSTDEWRDTSNPQRVVADQVGVWDALQAGASQGTVWNEWETNWTGVTLVEEDAGGASGASGKRAITRTVSTNLNSQTRTPPTRGTPGRITNAGIQREVNLGVVPFARSRKIFFKIENMKPNTRVYPFIDNIPISAYARDERPTPGFTEFTDNDTNAAIVANSRATSHPDGATTLVTDENGTLEGSILFPNNDELIFRTGERNIHFSDSATANAMGTTTAAGAIYTCNGILRDLIDILLRVDALETQVGELRELRGRIPEDPIAQSFHISETGGCFVTAIDLYFHTKDPSIPVTVEIREMKDGIITHNIIRHAQVSKAPADVNVYDPDDESPNPNLATQFRFPSPVYLQQGQEYAFVIKANSNQYNVWYAEIGENEYGTEQRISKQPFTGVLFMSQNNSTWSADQNKDIKFRLHRASFDTTVTGDCVLENGAVQSTRLPRDCLGTTSGSAKITVEHPNHHLFETISGKKSPVTISGVSAALNGIPASEINGTHDEVTDVEIDRYSITVTTSANKTGSSGDGTVMASQNQLFCTAYPLINQRIFPETRVDWGIRTATGISIGQTTPDPYVLDSDWSPVDINENTDFSTPRVISQSSDKTVFLRGQMSSNVNNISPVIDLERASLITIANRIDNPQAAAGTETGKNRVSGFIAETASRNGSAMAKYIAKTVVLDDQADALKVYTDINRPSRTFLDFYYRTANTESELREADWVMQEPNSPIPFNENPGRFAETEYTVDPRQTITANVNNSGGYAIGATSVVIDNIQSGRNIKVGDHLINGIRKLRITAISSNTLTLATGLYAALADDDAILIERNILFQAYQVKIVMRTLNMCSVPRCRDLRIISVVP